MITDVHAHLDFLSENKLKEIQDNPKIKLVVTNSVNMKSNKKNLELSKKYSKIKWAAGLYPEENLPPNDFIFLSKLIEENKSQVIAIGEIGMDFSHELPDKQLQKEIFKKQLELAKQLNVPAIIHTRKAEKEVIDILEEFSYPKIILHCFSGNFKLVKKAIELGYYFSIPTNIVRAEHFQKAIQLIPKNKILTETDSPYLSPFKEKQNEPAFISESIKKIAGIWKIIEEEVEKIVESNFEKLFKQSN
jgi:TatD DNase family protein